MNMIWQIMNIEAEVARQKLSPPRHQAIIGQFAGAAVIWNGDPLDPRVIPAKAGIQSIDSALPKVCRVDSRFRGNDCGFERPCLANDTNSNSLHPLLYECTIGALAELCDGA